MNSSNDNDLDSNSFILKTLISVKEVGKTTTKASLHYGEKVRQITRTILINDTASNNRND